jgi:arylsulfatase A-like enzyme
VNAGEGITDNAPLRGGKGMLYEGGVRVPWIANWPGIIQPGTSDEPINSVDLFPTLLDLAGAPPPKDTPLDGTSLLPLLLGKPAGDRKPLFWHFPGYLGSGTDIWRTTPAGAVRAGDWKLIEFFEDGRLELYNLKDDLGEKTNLADLEPAKRDELHKLLEDWRSAVHAPMPERRKEGP